MRLQVTYDHPIPVNAFLWTPKTRLERLHVHASLEIGLCLSGEGWFHFGDKKYRAGPGDIFVVNNQEQHIAQSDPDNPSTYIFLNFDPHYLLAEDMQLLLPFAYRPDRFDNHIAHGTALADQLAPLIRKIREELQDKPQCFGVMVKSALLQLAVTLLRHYADRLAKPEWRKMIRSYAKISSVLAYVDAHFREPLELKDVASRLGVSESRISHLFKEASGRTFKAYLLQLRMNEARRLLTSTDLSVTDVCYGCGFQSAATFYRVFQSCNGVSPSEYRSNYRIPAIFESCAE